MIYDIVIYNQMYIKIIHVHVCIKYMCRFFFQSYEVKPIFFGRKFEATVNQDIINSMDVYLFGNEMTGSQKDEKH